MLKHTCVFLEIFPCTINQVFTVAATLVVEKQKKDKTKSGLNKKPAWAVKFMFMGNKSSRGSNHNSFDFRNKLQYKRHTRSKTRRI